MFLCCLFGLSAVQAAETKGMTENNMQDFSVKESKWSTFFDNYIAGRLHIGTRMAMRILTDEDSGHKGEWMRGSHTFLGSIYALEVQQDYLPKYFFMKYWFSEFIAAELSYDSIKAQTRATSLWYPLIKSDGDITIYGPVISLVGTLPNKTAFTPYASLGLGYYFGDFGETDHWGLGYNDPAHYEAYGKPSTLYRGRRRVMEIDNEIGFNLGVGCTYDINQKWLLDLSVQYTTVDVDANFYTYTYGVKNGGHPGHFPMDNIAFRLGVAYKF